MKINVSFKRVDDTYNQEYADTYNFGEESENNMKYDWGIAYVTENVKEFIVKNDVEHTLVGVTDAGEEVKTTLENMYLLECVGKDGVVTTYGASSSSIRNIHKNQRGNNVYYYYYINANTEFIELTKGLIVAVKDLPKELIKEN